MRQTAMRSLLALAAMAVVLVGAPGAEANKLDIALGQFIDCPNADGSSCTADVRGYEQFMMAYAFGISPKLLAPAETLGYSGFYMGIEGTLTPREGSKALWDTGTAGNGYPDVMFMPGIHVRKGLPWSFEIGASLNYLAQSELVGLGGEVKWSLFEGYRHGFRGGMPDVAARGTVTRVLGQTDLDMTLVGVDGSISYPFGIGGMISLTPYAGFQYYWAIIRVEPLVYYDEENEYQQQQGDAWNTDGLPGPNLGRARLFGGFRFGYEMLAVTFELGWGLKKTWDTKKTDETASQEVEVGNQINISMGVGMDF
ncbi:MAG: hypothetical protein QNJ97_18670 [Myxococcota bacterium]|nr:hypothetical protein [Myxococcota bacterium]